MLGASGFLGKNLIRELLSTYEGTIVAAGRNTARLEELYGRDQDIEIVHADVRCTHDLRHLYKQIDLVINCVGSSTGTLPALTAIEQSLSYVDSGTLIGTLHPEAFKKLDQEARQHETRLIAGTGVLPGLERVLVEVAAQRLTFVDKLTIAAIFNDWLSPGSATDMLLETQRKASILREGTWIDIRQGSHRTRVCFPSPFKNRRVYAAPHLSTHVRFPANIKNYTLSIGTMGILSDALILIHSINSNHPRLTDYMSRGLQAASRINHPLIPTGFAMRMDAFRSYQGQHESHSISLYHPDTFQATAILIAYAIQHGFQNEAQDVGIFAFGEAVDPQPLLDYLLQKKFYVEGFERVIQQESLSK